MHSQEQPTQGNPQEEFTPETHSPFPELAEDYEFQELIGTDDIKAKVDAGINLAELADWCKANNVPTEIALDLMKRAVESNEAFIIY